MEQLTLRQYMNPSKVKALKEYAKEAGITYKILESKGNFNLVEIKGFLEEIFQLGYFMGIDKGLDTGLKKALERK